MLGFAFYLSIAVIARILIVMLNGKGGIGISSPGCIVGQVRCGHSGSYVTIPTCEGVTNYAKGRSDGQSCTVAYGVCNCIAYLIAVGKGEGVGGSCVVNLNNGRAVSIDSLAFCSFENSFGKCFLVVCAVYGSVGSTILGFAVNESVAVIVSILIVMLNGKGGIVVGSPSSGIGQVRSGHGGGSFFIPAREGVTNYAKYGSGGQSCAVAYGVRYCFAYLITVGKGKGVGSSSVVNLDNGSTVGVDSLTFCAFKDSVRKGLDVVCTVDGSFGDAKLGFTVYQGVAVIIGILIIMLYGVLYVTCAPGCAQSYVLCGHGGRNCSIPACKHVALHGEGRIVAYCLTVAQGIGSVFAYHFTVGKSKGVGGSCVVNLNNSRAVSIYSLAFCSFEDSFGKSLRVICTIYGSARSAMLGFAF